MVTRLITVSMALVLVMIIASPSMAGTGGGYEISWWTVDGGALMNNSGGVYSLSGTIGQPDAGEALSGGVYTMRGGFWAEVSYRVFIPLLLR